MRKHVRRPHQSGDGRSGRAGGYFLAGKCVGKRGHVSRSVSGQIPTRLSRYCFRVCFVRGSSFSFIHLCGNLDMEYLLRRSNLLIDEDVGGRTRADGAAGGFQR